MEDEQQQPKWHPDPTGRHEYRYWDGSSWTENVSDSGTLSKDPLGNSLAPDTGAKRPFKLSRPMVIAALVAIVVLIGLVLLTRGGDSGDRFGTSDVELPPGEVYVARYHLDAGEVIRIRATPTHRAQDLSIALGADKNTTSNTPRRFIESFYGTEIHYGALDVEQYHSDIFDEMEHRLISDYFSDYPSIFDPDFDPGEVFVWDYIDWTTGEEKTSIFAPTDGTYYVIIGDLNNTGAEISVQVEKWDDRLNFPSEFSDYSDYLYDIGSDDELWDFIYFSDYYSDYYSSYYTGDYSS